MNSKWLRRSSVDHNSSPIEMRFIDMFMAALGALLFMAMVLAFLIGNRPPNLSPDGYSSPETIIKSEPLKILTRSFPDAATGKPYELPIAYRGGSGPVKWELAAGEQELPHGIKFDQETGTLYGTPSKEGISRFVVHVRDNNTAQALPYELNIYRGQSENRGVEKWFAGIMLLVLLFVWYFTFAPIRQTRDTIIDMEKAYRSGQGNYAIGTGQGIVELITLPEGITSYQARLLGFKKFSKYLAWVILALAAWFFWRLWSN